MRRSLLMVTLACALPAVGRAQAVQTPTASGPTLLVFITVDQFRPDYFVRFEGQLDGGLGRLYRGGAFYTNASHDHAITETAPGHASTMSGRFPRSTGIVENSAGVGDPNSPLIGGGGPGASPHRFRGTVLIDWILRKNSQARALSVSRKDRGAILPVGRLKQSVFWYAGTGNFTTSTYYADTLPEWVRQFNARRIPAQSAGKAWTLLLDESQYSEPDDVPQENVGRGGVTFPHLAPTDSVRAAAVFPAFPWMDEHTLQFALAGLEAMKLGEGAGTDVLAISLSTTDAVGHAYGPDSRELHDHVLRLDRYLGAFFDSLYKVRDSSRVIVALTADHGVAPYPGVKSRDPNTDAGYAREALEIAWAMESRVAAALGDSTQFIWDTPILFMNRSALSAKRVSPDSVVRVFVNAVKRVPGIARVDRVRDLAR
ncbi:MAG TPA: alkaline phosphatase family protein, partial [Gemmatimonadaceae bacterium]|nr:alkaline phosphatase family protein [Gemmatimonadaceae bacterium]